MKRAVLIGIAAAAVACGPGANESHNSSQAGATARAGVADPANQPPVTLIGCLQNADQPGGGPAATSGRDDGKANARHKTPGAVGSPKAVGANDARGGSADAAGDQMVAGKGALGERFTLVHAKSATRESDPSASSYILDGNLDDLRAHVDQQVEVNGVLDAAAANTAGPQRVRVQSVRTLQSTCPRT